METTNEEEEEILEKLWELIVEKGKVEVESKKRSPAACACMHACMSPRPAQVWQEDDGKRSSGRWTLYLGLLLGKKS